MIDNQITIKKLLPLAREGFAHADIMRFLEKLSNPTASGCIEFMATRHPTGYGGFGYQGLRYQAHRFSFLAFAGDIPPGILICHKCDNRPCVNPDHLFLGDYTANILDAYRKNRRPKEYLKRTAAYARSHVNQKLSDADRAIIRATPEEIDSRELAQKFRVSPSTIKRIRSTNEQPLSI